MRALAFALMAATVLPAQSTGSQTGASRVALASVTDPRNRPLVDVGADDFVIEEAGASREVLSVRPADYPIVVLVDTGSEAHGDLPLMCQSIARFIERLGQRPIAIGTFGNRPMMLTSFLDERPTALARLAELATDPSAGSLLLEGAALAGRTIQATGALFSAIVILSATPIDATRDPIDELVTPVMDSHAMVHVVAHRRSQTEAGPVGSNARVRALAEQSRGEFTVIYSASSYQPALDRLADRLTGEMMVEYLVPIGSKPSDVKVGVRVVGAKVRGLGVAPR